MYGEVKIPQLATNNNARVVPLMALRVNHPGGNNAVDINFAVIHSGGVFVKTPDPRRIAASDIALPKVSIGGINAPRTVINRRE